MTSPASGSASSGSGPGLELPVHLTAFIGRDRELDELTRLATSTRLLTLTGAGGSGKTRLAREAAIRLAPEFEAIGWTDLSPLTQPELIAREVADRLRVPERQGTSPVRLVADTVAERRALIVLDNCEHMVAGCAELAETLLRTCPRLTVLATSREALGVAGETAWLVPPLAGAEAEQLFVERARAALPSFTFTATNTAAVREICRRLDGIPLAIELAASRVRVLSPEQIAQRLDDAFHLLTGGSRTALPRHRTLRATMEWSYGLLGPREQIVLRRLAVFAGSFTLDAAESICSGGALELDDILDGVSALVDRSLVIMEPEDGVARFRLLETVRQYALERLAESGEGEAFEEGFAMYFLEMIEAAEPNLIGGSNVPGLVPRLRAELDNLRSAASWAVAEPERTEVGLRFVGAGFWLWYALGMFREARWLADRALALESVSTPLVRGRALVSSALTALAQGEYDRAIAGFDAAIPLLRAGADASSIASALAKQGAARLLAGDIDGAIATLNEALAICGTRPSDHMSLVFARFWRGYAAYAQGDLDLAGTLLEANAELGRTQGLLTTLGHSLASLARIELARGQVARGLELGCQSLDIEVAIGDAWGIALALDTVAMAAARRGRPEAAARLLGGIDAHRARLALAQPGPAPAERTTLQGHLQAALADRFAALHAEGLALSTPDLVELAGRVASEIAGAETVEVLVADEGRAGAAYAPSNHRTGEALPGIRVRALGPLEVSVGGRMVDPSTWGSARPRELLVHLLLHPEGRTKEQVGLLFWPDASPAQLRNNFHVTLHRLRKALGGSDAVTLAQERYRIDPERVEEFDAAELELELAAARRSLKRQEEGAATMLEATLGRYRGDFLDGEVVGDWHLEYRDRFRRLYVDAALELASHYVREQGWSRAADVYRKVLDRDDLHEQALRGLMRALVEEGNRSQALRAYQRFAARLRDELGAEPEKETLRLVERLHGAA